MWKLPVGQPWPALTLIWPWFLYSCASGLFWASPQGGHSGQLGDLVAPGRAVAMEDAAGCAATRVLPLRSWRLYPPLPAWPWDRLRGNAQHCPVVGPDPTVQATQPCRPTCPFPAEQIHHSRPSTQGASTARVLLARPSLPGWFCPTQGWAWGLAGWLCLWASGRTGLEA